MFRRENISAENWVIFEHLKPAVTLQLMVILFQYANTFSYGSHVCSHQYAVFSLARICIESSDSSLSLTTDIFWNKIHLQNKRFTRETGLVYFI